MTDAHASFPLPGILLLVFILCKVFEYGPVAAWSWFWVLSPMWIPLGIMLVFMLFVLVCMIIGEVRS